MYQIKIFNEQKEEEMNVVGLTGYLLNLTYGAHAHTLSLSLSLSFNKQAHTTFK